MHAAETTIAHDQYVVAATALRRDRPDQQPEIVEACRFRTERRQHRLCIPAESIGVAEHQIRTGETARQRVFHDPHLHGIRARLEYGKNARAAHLAAQARNRGFNGRRMVREIVVYRDAVHRAAYFQPALHVSELGQGIYCLRDRYTGMPCCGKGCQRVVAVVLAEQVPFHRAAWTTFEEYVERMLVTRFGGPAFVHTKALDFAPAAPCQNTAHALLASVGDNQTIAGYGAYEMMELDLDRSKVRENVRMIEFQVIQNGGTRQVMNKLGALVEERGIVFIGLDHKERRIGRARGNAEIERYAADQKAGIQSRVFEYPGQHRRRSGLAVRAGYCEHPFPTQQVFMEPLRSGRKRQSAIQDLFHQPIAARHDIADHEQVRLQVNLPGVVTLDQFDSLRLQLRAHRRIDVGIAAGHFVTGLPGDHGYSTHERAADA